MTELGIFVEKFLLGLGLEVIQGDANPFSLIAQDRNLIVFCADVSTNLDESVKEVMSALASPFRSKRFGPKTMEMYAIFMRSTQTPLPEIERHEQDTRICRKLVISSKAEVESRLAFLEPLKAAEASAIDADQLFWTGLEKKLQAQEVLLLRQMRSRTVTIAELRAFQRQNQ